MCDLEVLLFVDFCINVHERVLVGGTKPTEMSSLQNREAGHLVLYSPLDVYRLLLLTGPIPPELGNLAALRRLHLCFNWLIGAPGRTTWYL